MYYDIMIIGGGPAGLTAGIYASRGGTSCCVLERGFFGGQAAIASVIENYPGIDSIDGFSLANNIKNQAQKAGCAFLEGEAVKIINKSTIEQKESNGGLCEKVDVDFKEGSRFRIELASGEKIYSKAIILAMGAKPKTLNIENEERFTGAGVSYCAVCDGPLYKGKTVCVIGGGNTAVTDALHLSGYAKQVYIIHRRDKFRADAVLLKKMQAVENISVITDFIPVSLKGNQRVEQIEIFSNKLNERRFIETNGVFVAIGNQPSTAFIKNSVKLNERGYIEINSKAETNTEGVFACGDCCNVALRQVVCACGLGAVAGQAAVDFINL